MNGLSIRLAVPSEQTELERLQLRASFENAGDRDALLTHPDSLELPAAQIAGGREFASEWRGGIVGLATVPPRPDRDSEREPMYVEPRMQRRATGRALVEQSAEAAR